ncbi:integrase/recombinase XerC [Balneicella halophila]|uniref:Tyrosine recombinase XerC n=1 Tax=Balneicella halophila TaxID=1537566 RepID=A0A7L4UP63_BALHA|nr:tyrosine-type recombinase/integrase [Balneicella halophila]PVX50923.1 integrase/recombinase XerC [Balneicella halophila]
MISEFLAYLKYQKRYSPHTVEAYELDLNQFVAWLGGEQLLLTAIHSDIRSWLLKLLKENKSQSTVHRKMSSLKAFYRYQMQQGEMKTNPVSQLTLPKKEKRLPTFLKEKETQALFSQIKYADDFEGERDEMILNLFYGTGMRVSELANLKISAIDYDRKLIKVLGKRNKERLIPLLPFVLNGLRNYIVIRDREVGSNIHLFVSSSNQALNRNQLYYIVKKYLSQVSSALKRSPHVLRHTFATQMLNSGADINALKELLGHSSLAATQVYTHSTQEQLKKDYKQAHPRA